MDSSALVKLYIIEEGTDDVIAWMQNADLIGTAIITRVEVVAALTRAIRGNRLEAHEVEESLNEFRDNWAHYQHINLDNQLIARADALAAQYALRGYDAIHLACALTWGELLGAPVSLATFDRELREAARKSSLDVFPQEDENR
ncbi:MAG: type II toxin-antitoxin system VapC family toxin [Anaerolineales bacterium]|nr:type II toxin-antitoxin system VapC family toxin [Anaerolineales bacterium]